MKYALTLLAGVWIGLAFNHLPPFQPFRDTPATPKDWVGPKMSGNWSEEERATIDRYFNGGR